METYGSCNDTDITLYELNTHKDTELLDTDNEEQHKDDVSHSTDDIFTEIGMGRWHILPILVAFLYQAASPTQLISSVFTNMPLEYKCATTLVNATIYDNDCDIMDNENLNVSCSKYEFNYSDFKSTFTSEFELVCDKSWISNLYQVSITVGLSIGSLLGGIGDKFGRLNVIRVGALGCLLGVLLVGFCTNVYIILTGRLVTGLFCNILNVSSLTLAMENTPTKHRSNTCLLIVIGYPLSVVFIGIISYFLQYWRSLHLLISFFVYLIPILSVFLDKSPRWLFQNGQIEEGTTLIKKIFKLNNSNMNDTYFSYSINDCKEKHELGGLKLKDEYNLCKKLKQNILVFFENQAMTTISLVTPTIWLITGLVYFGVPLNANNFTDNPSVYMVLLGLVEGVGIILGGMVLAKFGNIKTCALLFTVTGICLMSILIVSEQMWWINWILILITMMSISVCYNICYIMASELYPTQVRATGLGVCNCFCFMGFILGFTLIDTVARYSGWVFNVGCSVLCFIASVLMVVFLPETKGEPLCETVDDVSERRENLNKK